MPKVCLSMPTYRGAEYLKLVSIPSLLKQTFKDWRLYIVSDGEPLDNTEEVIDSFNDKRIKFSVVPRFLPNFNKSHGQFWLFAGIHALNEGLRLIKQTDCQYVFHLDHDDGWTMNHMSSLIELLKDNEIVYSSSKYYHNNIFKEIRPRPGIDLCDVSHSAIAYRIDADHQYYYMTDLETPSDCLHLRSFKGKMAHLKLRTCYYFASCCPRFSVSEINEIKML